MNAREERHIVAPASKETAQMNTSIVSRMAGRLIALACVSLLCVLALAGTARAEFGLSSFDTGLFNANASPFTQAGSHPYRLTTSFSLNSVDVPSGGTDVDGRLKEVVVDLPPGLVGNATAIPTCTQAQIVGTNECPVASQVGIAVLHEASGSPKTYTVGVFNVVPPRGFAAEFELVVEDVPVQLLSTVSAENGYHVRTVVANISEAIVFDRTKVTIWGVPGASGHDAQRGDGFNCTGDAEEPPANCVGGGHSVTGEPVRPLLTAPTSCGSSLAALLGVDSWQNPGQFDSASATLTPMSPASCEQGPFDPSIEARPTTNAADSPSGLDFHLKIPQRVFEEDPEGVSQANLKDARVALPAGLTVNPAEANGLGACTEAQVGYRPGTAPLEFTSEPAECPDASKLGTAEVLTPLLGEPEHPQIEHPLKGAVYLAQPRQNPFGSLLALYIAIDDPQTGTVLKLAGKVTPDPVTGQLTASFEESPQLPFEDFKLHFFGGAQGALRTPATCGRYETTSVLTPWSAPESGPPATPFDHFETTVGAGGGSCPHSATEEPNAPAFHAGTESPQAGAYSPFSLRLVRKDGSQELKGIDTTLPPGLVGKLAGIPYCSEEAIEAAEARSGQAEQGSPSCPAASEVGTVNVGAGAGPNPYYVQGHAYLAGPYKGAPLSLAIVTPAVAGPFDLGTVVVRTALYVNPETAQIHAVSDPIPTILQGIPLDVRSITLRMSRPNFTLNPTSCNAMSFTGSALSVLGVSAPLSQRFQAVNCLALPFAPRLSFSLKGAAHRSAHPAFKAVLTARPGEANIARAQVTLPHSEFLDQGHLNNICTRVQFAEGSVPGEKCPAGSIYGHAKAWTPLLDRPLEGPVYLRSNPAHKLPDLVAALNGQIQIALAGRIDSVNGGGIRNTFEVVPDAPVSRFVLQMQGGTKGLLVNSTNICHGIHKATVLLDGQNGKTHDTEPVVRARCARAHRKAGKHHGRAARARRGAAG
jgi:hypothetical protein